MGAYEKSFNGDINQDNTINIQDIILIINYILGYLNFSNDQLFFADLDPTDAA